MFSAATLAVVVSMGALVACAPPRSGGGSHTATTLAPQDSDGDGIPDGSDPCPNDADPSGVCPTTIHAVKNGTWAPGSLVALSNVLVTAVNTGSHTVFVQSKLGDPDYDGPEYSAVELQFAGPTLPAVGDRITVSGAVGGSPPSVIVSGAATVITSGEALPAPYLLPDPAPGTLTGLDGVLVTTTGITIASQTATTWTLSNGYQVGEYLIGDLPASPDGTSLGSVVGIGRYSPTVFEIRPRTTGDIS